MEETNVKTLQKAMEIYRERYGKGQVLIPQLDEIIRELKGENK